MKKTFLNITVISKLCILFVAVVGENAYSTVIEIHNGTTGGANPSYMKFVVKEEYNEELFLNGEDATNANGPPPALDIYSDIEGTECSTNGLPLNTPGADMYLRKRGLTGPIDNFLWVRVTNDEDLEHRDLVAYDNSDPNGTYQILNKTQGEWNTIDLPYIVDIEDGVYAIWHIASPAISHGDITDSTLVLGSLDGNTDIYDLQALASLWLDETLVGDNYSWGDLNYDRKNNLEDFAIIANSWLDSLP